MHGNGDYDHIVNACFENYLNVKLFDVSGKDSKVESRFVQQGNQLAFYDAIQSMIKREQGWSLQGYLVYPIASFHRLFSTSHSIKLEFPRTAYQVDNVAKQITGLAKSFWAGMLPKMQYLWFNRGQNIMELAPYLLYIISPDFKPVL